MNALKKFLAAMARVLFAGFLLTLYALVYMGPDTIPKKDWFNRFPIWFLIILDLVGLAVFACIAIVIVQLIVNN